MEVKKAYLPLEYKMQKNGIYIPDYMAILKLLEREKKTLSQIYAEAGITFCYIHFIKKELVSRGLITVEHIKGTSKYMTLTDKGRTFVRTINEQLVLLDIKAKDMLYHRRRIGETSRNILKAKEPKKEGDTNDGNN